ncbi:hypothetical protein F4604DRAFT_1686094 [Suillus subluteus]|nr:hypothetical protein F4604DRAFT_1686094 [Suillus subluteus]
MGSVISFRLSAQQILCDMVLYKVETRQLASYFLLSKIDDREQYDDNLLNLFFSMSVDHYEDGPLFNGYILFFNAHVRTIGSASDALGLITTTGQRYFPGAIFETTAFAIALWDMIGTFSKADILNARPCQLACGRGYTLLINSLNDTTKKARPQSLLRLTPYQALETAQPSRQATTGEIRGKAKEPKKADRDERQCEEIRFNLGYSFRDTCSGAHAHRRQARVREDGGEIKSNVEVAELNVPTDWLDTSDYPPPPTYEVATSPTLSTDIRSYSDSFIDTATCVIASDNALACAESFIRVLRLPGAKLVDIDPPQRWEMDRQCGVPLEERVTRHHQWSVESHVPAMLQRTRLFSEAPKRSPTSQSRFANSRLSLRIPEDQDPYSDDHSLQAASDASSPVTPKHKLPLLSLPLSPSRIFHRSQSPQPSSSVISLLRNPSPFFKSTPSLLNLSSPSALHGHGDHHFSRKLFHRKQKERAGAKPLEDWEVLDRTDSSHSSLEDSSSHPRPPSPLLH